MSVLESYIRRIEEPRNMTPVRFYWALLYITHSFAGRVALTLYLAVLPLAFYSG